MAKIPTELYVCVPRRSARGVFRTNIWANLTRKDTGEGIGQKKLVPFLDGASLIGIIYTQQKTGYAGPFDINPQTVGLHKTYVAFEGDTDFEPCKSEEITLSIDPNLLITYMKMQVTPVSGVAPLMVQVTGIGAPGSRPLDLMVFDATSTKRLQIVKSIMSNADGTFAMDYIFTKLGKYSIFINFLGDNKYASAWSNNGQTTTITVTGGGLPLSFTKTVTVTAKQAETFQWILSPTEPTAPEGYVRFPDLDLDFGVLGKYWAFIKTP